MDWFRQMAADFQDQVHGLTEQLSVIRASADWLRTIRARNDPQELEALRDIIDAVEKALRKTDAFRQVGEALVNGTAAAVAFRDECEGKAKD